MKVYSYNPVTKEFTGTSQANPNPRAPGEWLIPKNATTVEPPTTISGNIAVFESGAWVTKTDLRGQTYWLEDGSKHVIEKIGDILPTNYSLDPPPPAPVNITHEVEKFMDSVAKKGGWDNRVMCAIRASISGPWQEHGVAFLQWMDACWVKVFEMEAKAKEDNTTLTFEQVQKELPPMVWPK